MKTPFLTALMLCQALAQAALRTSADYSIPADTTDPSGNHAASADYSHDGSVGGVVGVSTAFAEVAKHGFIGQLYDPVALHLAASSTTLPEAGSLQLAASFVMDDETTLSAAAASIAWSIQAGQLSINTGGLATAGVVYQNTAATVQGAHSGLSGTLGLTVLESIPDNFGSYAGDGLGDEWQVQHFGMGNPDAGPLTDPDGDGQNNRFEFIAGLVPTDPRSFFNLTIQPVAGELTHKRLDFSPCLPDRDYQVLFSNTLLPDSWSVLPGTVVSQTGDQRTVTDPNAAAERRFYRVEIIKP
jgi:hypothetical protein